MSIASLILGILILGMNSAYAEQILTTYRDDGNATVWDGKWTFLQEWKRTSYDTAYGNQFVIRTGHDYKYLYVLIDFLSQVKFSKFSDLGIVCVDGSFDKETQPQKDDYCFAVPLGSKNPITLEGGSPLAINNHFTKIENDPGLIAVGGISDSNDRYTDVPHTSYEFRIPIEVFGKSDKYGFYVAAYVANENRVYSWPEDIANGGFSYIPSPSKWGDIISPDKSLPEFPLPLLALVISIFAVIYLSRQNQHCIK